MLRVGNGSLKLEELGNIHLMVYVCISYVLLVESGNPVELKSSVEYEIS